MIIELVTAVVLSVYDGDTIRVKADVWPNHQVTTSVRVMGIDTPEIRGKCPFERIKAQQAKRRVVEILPAGTVVKLVNVKLGKFAGRVVASVDKDGVDLGQLLVKEGLARSYDGGKRQGWCD